MGEYDFALHFVLSIFLTYITAEEDFSVWNGPIFYCQIDFWCMYGAQSFVPVVAFLKKRDDFCPPWSCIGSRTGGSLLHTNLEGVGWALTNWYQNSFLLRLSFEILFQSILHIQLYSTIRANCIKYFLIKNTWS
ncbi:hypothetical protein CDL12_17982 [Handroanthus impetiginosus]|uniref:Uncharacterized protein n=1 Tax=Handroanthus impetiginosus TaxID=429701 RepID=A0A2G9GVY1_9LAMI|nr:hypothetical protein CDL12_17982 [Handroanthus impetiginosus]